MSVARLCRVGSPFNGAELAEVDFEQSADTMYLAHIDHPPTKLIRYAHDSWAFSAVAFGPTIAAPTGLSGTPETPNTDADNEGAAYFPQPASYVVTAIRDGDGQESRASDSATVTNDLSLKRNYNELTWTGTADRYRVFKADNTQDFGYIGTTTETSFIDDNIGPDLTDGPPTGDNPFGGVGDYPSTVTFHEQRLMFGRTRNKPNGIWGSRSADFENFDVSRPQKASDGLAFALLAGRVNAVNQLVSLDNLLALTSDSLFKISGPNDDALEASAPPRSRRQIGRGSSRLGPLVVDNVVFYQPNVGSSVRAINYSFEVDGFQSNDVSIFSPHLFAGFSILWWAYAQEPRSLIWAGRSDGKLLCFTWEQDQQVWGWTLCDLGGFAVSGCTISEVSPDGRYEDRLYVAVRRTIGGVERTYIERMAAVHWEAVEDTCFVDCGVTYAFDTPQTALPGLDHLEGRAVVVLADGNVVEELSVYHGTVTIPNASTKVTVGLPYTALIETLPLSFNQQNGSNVGRKSNVGEAIIRVVNTRGVFAGPTEETQFEIKPRTNEDYGAPNALKTGDYLLDAAAETQDKVSFVVTMPYPLPATITGVALDAIITG